MPNPKKERPSEARHQGRALPELQAFIGRSLILPGAGEGGR